MKVRSNKFRKRAGTKFFATGVWVSEYDQMRVKINTIDGATTATGNLVKTVVFEAGVYNGNMKLVISNQKLFIKFCKTHNIPISEEAARIGRHDLGSFKEGEKLYDALELYIGEYQSRSSAVGGRQKSTMIKLKSTGDGKLTLWPEPYSRKVHAEIMAKHGADVDFVLNAEFNIGPDVELTTFEKEHIQKYRAALPAAKGKGKRGEIDDEVFYLFDGKIFHGKIDEIKEDRASIIYTVGQAWVDANACHDSVDSLVLALRSNLIEI